MAENFKAYTGKVFSILPSNFKTGNHFSYYTYWHALPSGVSTTLKINDGTSANVATTENTSIKVTDSTTNVSLYFDNLSSSSESTVTSAISSKVYWSPTGLDQAYTVSNTASQNIDVLQSAYPVIAKSATGSIYCGDSVKFSYSFNSNYATPYDQATSITVSGSISKTSTKDASDYTDNITVTATKKGTINASATANDPVHNSSSTSVTVLQQANVMTVSQTSYTINAGSNVSFLVTLSAQNSNDSSATPSDSTFKITSTAATANGTLPTKTTGIASASSGTNVTVSSISANGSITLTSTDGYSTQTVTWTVASVELSVSRSAINTGDTLTISISGIAIPAGSTSQTVTVTSTSTTMLLYKSGVSTTEAASQQYTTTDGTLSITGHAIAAGNVSFTVTPSGGSKQSFNNKVTVSDVTLVIS